MGEKRWADRKSRLANLPGFRYFSLLRRVEGDGSDQPSELDDKNYISMTVWENRENFNEWRTGEAFKEAHGGGGTMLESVVGFTKLLTTQLFILDGGPKVAFYDGLIPAINSANTKNDEKIQGGWRQVEADGKILLNQIVLSYRVNIPSYRVKRLLLRKSLTKKKLVWILLMVRLDSTCCVGMQIRRMMDTIM